MRQRGSMLLVSIFVILVLGALALTLTQILQDNARSTVYEVYGARTLNAANSGAQRALNEVLGPGSAERCNDATKTFSLPNGGGFSDCEVGIVCRQFDISETSERHFEISSHASCSAAEFIIERSVQVQAKIRI